MEKLSKEEISKVKEVLTDFIKKTAGEENPETLHKLASNIMGPKFADNPALIKQAASAYNSNKSIFKLSDEGTANTDFGLLNPNALFADLQKAANAQIIEKAAASDFVVKFSQDVQPMQKVASNVQSVTSSDKEEETMTKTEFSNYMKDTLEDCSKVLTKLANRRDICEFDEMDLRDRFCRNFRFLSKDAKAKVAKHLIDTYREEGKRLIDIYNATADVFNKVASVIPSKGVKSFPKGDIYTQAEEAICANYVAKQANDALNKSCEIVCDLLKGMPGLYVMHKKASTGDLLKYVGGNAIADPIMEAFTTKPADQADLINDVISRRLLGELRELEVRNVLVDMYGEPFIASYPAEDVEAATIKALQMLPVDQRKHPRRHAALLKTWVADILGRGGNISASDTDKILKADETYFKRNAPNILSKASEIL